MVAPTEPRICDWCKGEIPAGKRADAQVCSVRCRTARTRSRDTYRHQRERYGISADDMRLMRGAQADRCAVCSADGELVVDHHHATGAVRGLLCRPCNAGIGMLGDNPTRLRNAAAYLEAHA